MAQPEIKTVKTPAAPSRESAYAALNGVSVDWLRRAFHMSRPSCESKLRGLKTISVTQTGVPLYDLGEAAARLVKPKMDLEEYLEDITVDMLPDKLKEPFWNAKLKQQRYEKNAGELWRTEAVVAIFGSVLKDMKERMRMINTIAEREMGLSPEQQVSLREIVNDVQKAVYDNIMSLENKTPSSVAELNRKYGEVDPEYKSATVIEDDFEY